MFQLRDEHVKKFHNDGYLIVENLFDVGDLERLRRRIEELSSADGVNLTKGRRQVEPRVEMGEEVPMEGYASSLRMMSHVAFEDPIFLEHAREDRIIDIIEALLGPDIVLAQDQLFMKPPRVGSRRRYHQDAPSGFDLDPPDQVVT